MLGLGVILFFVCNHHKNNLSQTGWSWILEAYKSGRALRTRALELVFCHDRKHGVKSRSCFLLKAAAFQPVLLCVRDFISAVVGNTKLVPSHSCAAHHESYSTGQQEAFSSTIG